MAIFLDKKVRLYSIKEKYCFDNSINSKVLCFAFGLVAEIERELISLRTKEALAYRKKEGIHIGRKKGSGKNIKFLEDKKEDIINLVNEGTNINQISKILGISRSAIYRFIRTHNIEYPKVVSK